MNAKQAQHLRDWLLLIGFLIMLGSYIWEPLFLPGLMVACSCLIPDYLFNKCPHCGRHLGRNEGMYCHHCGKGLEN